MPLIEDFIQNLKDSDKFSDNTIESYKLDINKYAAYANENGVQNLTKADSEFVSNYIAHLQKLGRAGSTISRNIASLRLFYKFLLKSDAISANPTSALKTAPAKKKLPQILTNDEVISLLEQPSGNDLKSYRDKAMLELLYATGIRVTELISLDISHINLEIGYVICKKSTKERIIPLYDEAKRALNDYMTKARGLLINSGNELALFVNYSGRRLTRQGFWKIIKHYKAKANIKKEITPDMLRHSFAAHLLQNGAELKVLQEMLGHGDISSTKIYTEVLSAHIRSVYSKAHPRARKASGH